MKCPHCLVEFHANKEALDLGADRDGHWYISKYLCPNDCCNRIILFLGRLSGSPRFELPVYEEYLFRPKGISRSPIPPEVPAAFAADYREACLVLADSPKASAALSRRCLQHLLRETAKVTPSDLSREIQEILDRNSLPSLLAQSLDAIRNIGNFAAHPIKGTSTGEIVEVEPGEAEWNLDVLESLFDFFFVQPEILRKKREALNKKLQDAGKPPMK